MFVVAVSVSGLVACGGGEGVDCSFSACGGDPVGTWEIDGACFDVQPLIDDIREQCPEAQVNISIAFGGTVTIDASGTYSATTTVNQSSTITVPGSCLMGATSCDQLDSETLDCSGDIAVDCTCRIMDSMTNSDAGNWTVSGDEITLGTDDPALFCQQGNTLKVQSIPQDPMDSVTTIVLTRR